jgi:hypothetical protein
MTRGADVMRALWMETTLMSCWGTRNQTLDKWGKTRARSLPRTPTLWYWKKATELRRKVWNWETT